jgi:HEPN domain-containing protein
MADSRIRDSEALKREAAKALSRCKVLQSANDFPGAIEAAQHCIELSVKSMLVRCDVQHPSSHDVSKQLEILMRKLDECSESLRRGLSRAQWIMQMWEPANSFAVYGTHDTKPQDLFYENDVHVAIYYAEDAYWTCYQLLLDVAVGRMKVKGG